MGSKWSICFFSGKYNCAKFMLRCEGTCFSSLPPQIYFICFRWEIGSLNFFYLNMRWVRSAEIKKVILEFLFYSKIAKIWVGWSVNQEIKKLWPNSDWTFISVRELFLFSV